MSARLPDSALSSFQRLDAIAVLHVPRMEFFIGCILQKVNVFAIETSNNFDVFALRLSNKPRMEKIKSEKFKKNFARLLLPITEFIK